jgi:hypothetical protein
MTRLLSPGPVRLGPEDIDTSDSVDVDIRAAYAALQPPPLQRVGRPSAYTEELGIDICRRIANGECVSAICKEEGYPHRDTVAEWREVHPEFERRYVRAMRCRIEDLVDECRVIATKTDTKIADRKLELNEIHFQLASLHPARFSATLSTLPHSPEQPKQIEVAPPDTTAIGTGNDRALVAIRRARLVAVT